MEAVLALARSGTLARAAALLGMDGSTVFRTLQRVEKALRQRLFERSRSGYRPTELGLQLAQHAEKIEAELEAARAAAQSPGQAVSGLVRISTTDTLLHGVLMPALNSLAAEQPLLQFELTASNEPASLTKRDADIALRATRKPPAHLVGRLLGSIRSALFVPKSWGRKRLAALDLQRCAWLAPDDTLPDHPSVRWRRRHHPQAVPRYQVNSILSVAQGVAMGLGIGVVPLFLARERKELVMLGEPLDECETQLWLLLHPESRHLQRIAVAARHLAERVTLD